MKAARLARSVLLKRPGGSQRKRPAKVRILRSANGGPVAQPEGAGDEDNEGDAEDEGGEGGEDEIPLDPSDEEAWAEVAHEVADRSLADRPHRDAVNGEVGLKHRSLKQGCCSQNAHDPCLVWPAGCDSFSSGYMARAHLGKGASQTGRTRLHKGQVAFLLSKARLSSAYLHASSSVSCIPSACDTVVDRLCLLNAVCQ